MPLETKTVRITLPAGNTGDDELATILNNQLRDIIRKGGGVGDIHVVIRLHKSGWN